MHGEARFVEGNVRQKSLREIWNRADGFAYNRSFKEENLGGFCRVCRYRDVCRGGCSWAKYAQGGTGNENCFYHQVVKHRRFELLAEVPTDDEIRYFHDPVVGVASVAGGGR
jgi:radical SAM protein with 4Fe4S-binding SPASM domain